MRHRRHREHGQMLVLFALCLVAIIAVAGLLIDGGMAWSNRRQAQAAADTAALAAAKAEAAGASHDAAALVVAQANQFGLDTTDCSGATLPGNAGPGVQVNHPPLSGLHSVDSDPLHANSYVEVVATRKMTTTFSGALGMDCWLVSARAVSQVATAGVATCSFCALNSSDKIHTLVLKNGATLRVDGDIYVNSTDGGTTGTCVPTPPAAGKTGKGDKWYVCGDGFDVFGTGGHIAARTISVSGGWETHDGNPTKADYRALVDDGTACPQAPDPVQQTAPWLPSNVCVHMPQIADPLNDPAEAGNIVPVPVDSGPPVAGVNGCPAGALIPSGGKLTISSPGAVLCPGTYSGGIAIVGSGTATMRPGVYYMAGGGFSVIGAGSVNGTAGVMIYSTGGGGSSSTNPGEDLVPPHDNKKKDVEKGDLKGTPGKDAKLFQDVLLEFKVSQKSAPLPTGVISFYNGEDVIAGCGDLPVQPAGGKDFNVLAKCTISFSTTGTKALSAVYFGDAVYNATGDTLVINVATAAGGQIDIDTTGSVRLYGPTTGIYKGLTIFQDRTSKATIDLHPGSGSAPACGASWLTQDVPDVDGVDPPPACGAIGGLRGTVYAANQDALVYITASGLANLQVIAGKIQIDSNADARFAYTPEYFANGNIRLVE